MNDDRPERTIYIECSDEIHNTTEQMLELFGLPVVDRITDGIWRYRLTVAAHDWPYDETDEAQLIISRHVPGKIIIKLRPFEKDLHKGASAPI